MRVSFDQVFQQNPDGSFTPRAPVRVGGVTMGPGVSFGTGVSFGGFDIRKYVGKDLDVVQHEDGTIEIKGVYE